MMRNIVYQDPALSIPIACFLSSERRAITKCKRFVTTICFISTQLQMISCLFKPVSEPHVPEHVQRKEHVFQTDLGFE